MSTGLKAQFNALFDAVDRDEPQAVTDVIRSGADPNGLNPRTGEPPLFLALERSVKVVDALLAGGANPNLALEDDGETALFTAIAAQDISMVEHLIAGGARTLIEDKRGYTPLKVAKELGDPVILAAVKQQHQREMDELAHQATSMEKSVPAMKTLKFRMGGSK